MATIPCPTCGSNSPLKDIPPSKRKATSYYCKSCRKDIRKKQYWNNVNKEREYAKKTQFERRLNLVYGLTVDSYEELKETQNNKCAICDAEGTLEKRLVIDHDHTTGNVRQLLCDSCNRGIGLLGDDAHRLQKAADYLRKHSVQISLI